MPREEDHVHDVWRGRQGKGAFRAEGAISIGEPPRMNMPPAKGSAGTGGAGAGGAGGLGAGRTQSVQ